MIPRSLFFSGGFNSSFVDHILSSFHSFLMPVQFLIVHLSLFYCPECSKYLRRLVFSFKISSTYFEDVISFKSFNSTGATSLLNCSTVFPFEWALTQGLFPGSYLTLPIFTELSSNCFSKFDVRMNYHQSNVFLQDLSNSFHR